MKRYRCVLLFLLLAMVAGVCVAQRGGWGRRSAREDYRTARQFAEAEGYTMTTWSNAVQFERDVFTFVRIRYDNSYNRGGRGRGGGGWRVDLPESDLNFSWRLQQITSIKVNPDGLILRLTDPELFRHPFIYIVEPGALEFSEDEVQALRRYLLSGGFLMVDDFWGDWEWMNFYEQIKRVFPEREPVELPVDHPIFSCVFPLKDKPQIPAIGRGGWFYGRTWEGGPDTREPHYKGIFDDKGRMMAIICHNTDLGDGWEEEASNPDYFRLFSERYAYPLGINIIFYAMTH